MRPATFTWLAVVIAVCCAAIEWLGIAGWIAAAVLAASVAMHVLGNALGTSLREATDRDLRRVRAVATAALPLPRPRAHRLEQRTSLGRLVPVWPASAPPVAVRQARPRSWPGPPARRPGRCSAACRPR